MRKAVFFGDSNTYGYDPAGFMGGRYPRSARWTVILQKLLEEDLQTSPEDVWQIAADGMPGRALPRTRWEWEYLKSLLFREMPVDLFGVMLGTNDLLSTLRPDAARAAREMNDLLSFVDELLAGSGEENARKPKLLLIAPPEIVLTDQSYLEPYVCGDKSYAQVYREEGRKLSQYYRELAAFRQICFADASSWKLDFAFDGVHLSEEGHARFAAEMAEVMRGL